MIIRNMIKEEILLSLKFAMAKKHNICIIPLSGYFHSSNSKEFMNIANYHEEDR